MARATSTWAATTAATTAACPWVIAARSCPTRTRACTSTHDPGRCRSAWANKVAGAGGQSRRADWSAHRDDLLRIEGIGAKAIEELKEGLEQHNLLHVIEDDLSASSDDMSQLLDMVFSPDDTILIGGDEPATFNTEGEDMLGEALPPRSYHRNLEELDELLGNGALGFGLTSRKDEEESNEAQANGEE